jgi:hypothetical protein
MASLELSRDTDAAVVLPGHGEPIEDHRALIEQRFAMHSERRDKLEGLIRERRRSAYELARELWGNVAVTQAYLTISEVLGHVDLLLNDGRVREVTDPDGIVRFETT